MPDTDDTQPDGYYDEDVDSEEIDLSFLDEDEPKDEAPKAKQ
jgi:hypothetical protein